MAPTVFDHLRFQLGSFKSAKYGHLQPTVEQFLYLLGPNILRLDPYST